MKNIVIVGGGAAGFKALGSILEDDPNARVTLFSHESQAAYERPMLSKEYLISGGRSLRYLPLQVECPNVDIRLSSSVSSIDRASQAVICDDSNMISYDKLILATGSRVRKLRISDALDDQFYYLRTLQDAQRLQGQLVPGSSLLIIGGGFIGLEIAAAAANIGVKSVIIESQYRLLSRIAPEHLSSQLYDLHVSNGTVIHTSTSISHIEKLASSKFLVLTTNNLEIVVDTIVVGIGVIPNVELAEACGLEVQDGIVVDTYCRTSDADIYAAGEVTCYPVPSLGVVTRSESWTTAIEQGAVAGRSAIGKESKGFNEVPWLWSDQFDTSIQYLGVPLLASKTSFHAHDNGSWVEIGWSEEGLLLGAIGYNANREISEIRRNMRKGLPTLDKYKWV